MSNSPYLYEKLIATRHAEICRDMELSRKATQAEYSSSFVEGAAGKLGALLIGLGSRLQGTEQPRRATI